MLASGNAQPTFDKLFDLGKGGVAVVRAERMVSADGTERVVAVKRLLPLVAGDPKTRQMFFDEARLASLLDHPNASRIVAVGLDEEPFIAMEMVVGESLAALIHRAREQNEPPLEPMLGASLVAEVCDALHAAHELNDPATSQPLNLVHRDVSPQNILIGFDGVCRLTDFGIAKALGFGSRTRTGEVKGKLAYMSPEQVMRDPMDRRSDLFAVGAVLFEVLTGVRMLGEGNDVELLRRLSSHAFVRLHDAMPHAPEQLCSIEPQSTTTNARSLRPLAW